MAVNFDDQSTGRSYDNYPKDPEAREQIAIVKDKVEKLANTTVSRQVVTNLENKFKQNELDNVNYRNQVGETVRTIEEKVEGLDGGNTEKIANLEAVVNNKANKDIVDSLLNQIEGSVKQINGVVPDANGNVIIDLNTQNLVGKQEFTEKTDQIALQMMDKVNAVELENVLGRTDELTTIIAEKANQSEIDAAKGGFSTLKEKLDDMVVSGGGSGGTGTITTETIPPDANFIVIDNTPPKNVSSVSIANPTENSFDVTFPDFVSLGDAKLYKIYVNGIYKGDVEARLDTMGRYTVTDLVFNTSYTVKVTSVDDVGNESSGTTTVGKTNGINTLTMNGTSKIVTKPLTFTTFEMICKLEALAVSNTIVDPRPGIWGKYLLRAANGGIVGVSGWEEVKINGYVSTEGNVPPLNQQISIYGRLAVPGTDDVTIFDSNKGTITSIKFYNGDVLVASYDLTVNPNSTTIPDLSGKGNTATLTGGVWS